MSDNSQKQSFLDNIFSYTTWVDDYWYSQEFKIAGIKIKHRMPPKEYMNSEIYTSENDKLYADLCNYTKRFKKITLFIDHSYGGGCDKYFWKQVQQLSKSEIILRIQYFYAEKPFLRIQSKFRLDHHQLSNVFLSISVP